MSVYSTSFFAGTVSGSTNVLYTVPPLMTVVVRDIEAFNAAAAGTIFTVTVGGAGPSAVIWADEEFPAAKWQQWSGRVVMNSGWEILCGAGASPFYVMVSGYLLTH